MNVTINKEQRLYVIPSGNGYSTLGFDVADRKGRAVISWCRCPGFTGARIGSIAHYREYERIMRDGEAYHKRTGERCMTANCPEKFVNLLTSLRNTRLRVQIHYGDVATGRDWCEENDTRGYIGLSTGWCPVFLMVFNERSHGGGGILADCIVKITATQGGRVIYQAENYQTPNLEVIPSDMEKYAACVTRDGEIIARFKTAIAAERYKARWCK